MVAGVKANQGAAGIDAETIERFETKLAANLYKLCGSDEFRQLLSAAGKGSADPKEVRGRARVGRPHGIRQDRADGGQDVARATACVYVNFSPAVSRDALKAMRQTIRGWRVQLMNDKSLADLSAMLGPILRGWQQYYGHFHGSALKSVWRRVTRSLIGWLMRKAQEAGGPTKRGPPRRSNGWRNVSPAHWSIGRWAICRRMDDGSRMS